MPESNTDVCNSMLRTAVKYEAAISILHFLLDLYNRLPPPAFSFLILAAHIANGNTLPIAADYV